MLLIHGGGENVKMVEREVEVFRLHENKKTVFK